MSRLPVVVSVAALLLGACSAAPAATVTTSPTTQVPPTGLPPVVTAAPTTATTTAPPPSTTTTTPLPPGVIGPPDWLGTRVLPLTEAGFGESQPTPPELVDRRFTTEDVLPPPPDGKFSATVHPVPPDVAARSTWHEDCPVTLDQLRYVTVSFVGFDGRPHTGELLVNADHAEAVAGVFEELWDLGFPIESMRISPPEVLDAPPTGDGNNTESFVCRDAVQTSSWSRHAYGLAVDVNPFHNPYVRGDVVLPELASAYLDRDRRLPGMLVRGDGAVEAFEAIGWVWGGEWSSLKDWQHFSDDGR